MSEKKQKNKPKHGTSLETPAVERKDITSPEGTAVSPAQQDVVAKKKNEGPPNNDELFWRKLGLGRPEFIAIVRELNPDYSRS